MIDEKSLQYLVGSFAAQMIAVVANPLHVMYPKVNRFLNRAPKWDISRLPSYWAEKILHNPPEEDDGFHKEVSWLLEVIIDGLRTPEVSWVMRN